MIFFIKVWLAAVMIGSCCAETYRAASETPFALRRWIIEDAVGVTTKVTLQNPVFGEDFNNFLFAVPSYN